MASALVEVENLPSGLPLYAIFNPNFGAIFNPSISVAYFGEM
jgi:hypothetical protein